jgi:cell fate regulator YaaT (PSP1 superfamily)
MHRVVGVRFKTGCKIYNFDAGELELSPGDTVVVNSEQGMGCAKVAVAPAEIEELPGGKELKKVIRKATEDDMYRIGLSVEKEAEAFRYCSSKISEREMVMKLVRVEWAFDNSRATFYFTADGRVDFRELVRDLAFRFKIRIEMRQIGVRDEAKMIGGYGPCGRELCCASFLKDFEPVSIKMAKKQNLVLNPQKISGVCGRLMCCLGYEYTYYDEIKKDILKRKQEEELKRQEELERDSIPELTSDIESPKPGGQEDKSKRKRRVWKKKAPGGASPEGGKGGGQEAKTDGARRKDRPKSGERTQKPKEGERTQKPKDGDSQPPKDGKSSSSRRRRRGGRGRGKGGQGGAGGSQPGGQGGSGPKDGGSNPNNKPPGGGDKPTG